MSCINHIGSSLPVLNTGKVAPCAGRFWPIQKRLLASLPQEVLSMLRETLSFFETQKIEGPYSVHGEEVPGIAHRGLSVLSGHVMLNKGVCLGN